MLIGAGIAERILWYVTDMSHWHTNTQPMMNNIDMSHCHLEQETTNNNDEYREFAGTQVSMNGKPMVNNNTTLGEFENIVELS